MREEYAGRQYVGIDLHRRRSVIVRQTEHGELLESVRIDNERRARSQVVAVPKLVRWAAVEAAQKSPAGSWLTSTRAGIAQRRGHDIATVAVARKLLTLVYHGLRDGHIRALARPRQAAA